MFPVEIGGEFTLVRPDLLARQAREIVHNP